MYKSLIKVSSYNFNPPLQDLENQTYAMEVGTRDNKING